MSDHSPQRAEILAAVPTLFDEHGAVDPAANGRLYNALGARVDGVFVAGTTGEFPALDHAERVDLIRTAVETAGADRVVAHVGAASTRESVRLAEAVLALGVRRLAALTPYYLPADLCAVERHFAAITAAAAAAGAEVYGYLFPERTGVAVEPADYAGLAESTGLAGAKLSGAAAARFAEYRAALPAGASVWSGSDTALAAVVRAGGTGVVSGMSAAFPEPFAALADAAAAGAAAAERCAQARVDAVLAALGGTPQGIKNALRQQGIGTDTMRMPTPLVSGESEAAIAGLITAEQAAS
ncbi:4-hydroxy-tetrahydrodipicolinate synthase [Streptomonospora sediminis]